MKKILIFFLIDVLLVGIAFPEKEIIYNSEKGWYEIRDKETKAFLGRIQDDSSSCTMHEHDVINQYPYLEGWPVLMPYGMEYPLNVGDINNDSKQELSFMTEVNGRMHLYSYQGLPVSSWIEPIYSFVPTFGDIDNDKNLEIIATLAGGGYIYGAGAYKINSQMLRGFPSPPNRGFFSSSIADINRDGNYEIIFAPYPIPNNNYQGLHILGSWGGLLPGFPVFFSHADPPSGAPGNNYGSPSIGDFDNDGLMDVAVTAANGRLYLINADGSHLRNWPVLFYMGGSIEINPPAIGDIDNDGRLEVATTDSSFQLKLFVFNDDGSLVKGFPVNLEVNAQRSPSLGDLDSDGKLELFAANGTGKLFGYKNDGTNLPGWPIDVEIDVGCVGFNTAPTIGDIDGDGQMEVVAAGSNCQGCGDSILVGYNLDGSMVTGFPLIEIDYRPIAAAAALTDLDNNGTIDICLPTEHCLNQQDPAYVYCYALPYPYDKKKIAWENYAHDPQHTGRYVNPAIDPPEITRIKRNVGSNAGGYSVEIEGKNFRNGSRVFFDGVPATDVQVINSTTIFATVPPHRICSGYINDISVSPYQLSASLANRAVTTGSGEPSGGAEIQELSSSPSYSAQSQSASAPEQGASLMNGCTVNVVVAHASPDQRQGVLRAGFTYTDTQPFSDNTITLFVSKYNPAGTFENYGANWQWMNPNGLWAMLNDESTCIPKPYPSGHISAYYGNQNYCNYNTGARNYGDLVSPAITVDSPDAKIRFRYYRNVEYSPSKTSDVFKVKQKFHPVPDAYDPSGTVLWQINSQTPSQDQWVQSPEISIGAWAGQQIWIFFQFDTVDALGNYYRGIAVDDVELIGAHWSPWAEMSGEVILNWTGGLPKYFVYRGSEPNYEVKPPELRSYTPFTHYYENSLNNDISYYYEIR